MIKNENRFNEWPPANFDGIFYWDFLKPAFGDTNIEPMDIDAIIERHGQFLIFETKEPSKEIPLGQQITLMTLLQTMKGSIRVMVIWGKPPLKIEAMEIWGFNNNRIQISKMVNCNDTDVLKRVTDWFNWADSHKEYYSSKNYKDIQDKLRLYTKGRQAQT
jgi:hypothetical protein